MISRRAFVAGGVAALAAPLATEAQQAGKVYRIGVLSPDVPPPQLVEEFQEGLRERGYVDGMNTIIEARNAGGRNDRLPTLADELVRLPVDVILAVNTPAAQAAKNATTTIPIVMTRVGDPIKSGLVPSLANPGANLTGLGADQFQQAAKIGAEALELCRRTKERGHEAYALCVLGDIACRFDRQSVDEAERYYVHAMALAGELHMRPLVAHCHIGLDKLYRRTGKRQQAQQHVTTGTTIYRGMGMTYWLENAETEMAALQ